MNIDDLPPRIRVKIEVDESTNCWNWTAAKDRRGYGRVRWENGARFAHRVVYALLAGDPGKELDHLCRNPSCVSPLHLEPVTRSQNMLRAKSGQRDRWPVGRTCPAGHIIEGDNLYSHYSQRLRRWNNQCRACKAAADRRRKERLKEARR